MCFHGYGQDGSVFEVFEPALGKRFSVVSVDLPFQGKTIWREKEKLSVEGLREFMEAFFREIGAEGKISIMAYSIGGNYALGFISLFSEHVNNLWLIAADGLKSKPAFNFITKTRLGRWLFGVFILYPAWVFYWLKLAGVLGLASKRVLRFYYSTIDSRIKRKVMMQRWASTARIAVRPKRAIDAINRAGIRVCLIFGKHDSVIPVQNAVRFHKKIPSSKLVVVDTGHKLLVPETNKILEESLSDKDDSQLC